MKPLCEIANIFVICICFKIICWGLGLDRGRIKGREWGPYVNFNNKQTKQFSTQKVESPYI